MRLSSVFLRPVSGDADKGTQLGPAGRHVGPVFQHSRRHYVGFARDLLVKAGSVGFVEDAVGQVGLFFSMPRRLVLRGSLMMRVPATDIFRDLRLDRCSQGNEFAMSNFRRRLKTPKTGLSVRPTSRTRSIRCGFWGGCMRFSHCPLFSHPKLGAHNKRSIEPVLLLILRYILSLRHFQWVLLWRCLFFCKGVTDHRTLARSADSPLIVCREHSTPPLLGSIHGMGSVGFRWSYADNLGVLARGANSTDVHLARLIAGVQKAGLDVSCTYPCQRKCRCSRWRSVSSQRILQLSGQTHITYSLCRTDGLFAPSYQRSVNGARQWSRVLSGAQQWWCSFNPWCKLQARAGVLFDFWRALVNTQ